MPHRIHPFASWLIIVLLILGSARGALIIHFDFRYDIVYPIVAGSLFALALIGALCSRLYRGKHLALLKLVLTINVILFVFHIAFNFALTDVNIQDVKSAILQHIAPFIIFIVLFLKEKQIETIFIIVTLLIGFSVIYNFIEMIGPNSNQYLTEYRSKLRGSGFGLSNSGTLYGVVMRRIGGYTGSVHDTGNILGMSSVYFLVSYFVKKTNPNLLLFIMSFVGLLMAQGLSNIIVTLFTMVVFYLYILKKKSSVKMFGFGVIAIIVTLSIKIYAVEVYDTLFIRINSSDNLNDMANQLSFEELISSLPLFLSGHGYQLNSIHMSVEMSFLKMIYQLNIFHFSLYMFILLYPVFLFFKHYKFTKNIHMLYPSLAVNIYGILSLLHYGSLLRSTSIFLYFTFSGLFIMIFLKHRHAFHYR